MRERSDMLSFETLKKHSPGILRFGESGLWAELGIDNMLIYLLDCSFDGDDIWLAELSEIKSSSMLAIRLIRRVASFMTGSEKNPFLPALLRVLVWCDIDKFKFYYLGETSIVAG